jgi:hypothetical protein
MKNLIPIFVYNWYKQKMSYYDYIRELNDLLIRNGFVRNIRYRIIERISTLEMFEMIDNQADKERADQLYQLIYMTRCRTSEEDKQKFDNLLWGTSEKLN